MNFVGVWPIREGFILYIYIYIYSYMHVSKVNIILSSINNIWGFLFIFFTIIVRIGNQTFGIEQSIFREKNHVKYHWHNIRRSIVFTHKTLPKKIHNEALNYMKWRKCVGWKVERIKGMSINNLKWFF